MNWLERARRELAQGAANTPANSAEGTATAVMAVFPPSVAPDKTASFGTIGSAQRADVAGALPDDVEERAAILQFDGGLSREEAERLAWTLVYPRSLN